MIITGSPEALFAPNSPSQLGAHGEAVTSYYANAYGLTDAELNDWGVSFTAMAADLSTQYQWYVANRPDLISAYLKNFMRDHDFDTNDVAFALSMTVSDVMSLLDVTGQQKKVFDLQQAWTESQSVVKTFMSYGHTETSAKNMAAKSLKVRLADLGASVDELAQANNIAVADVNNFLSYAVLTRAAQAAADETAKYVQMQQEAIAQKAANEAADRRNSVLSWYAGNQDAEKNPSEASIAYWTNQLVVKPYDTVFADFTNTVAAYVEQQRIAAVERQNAATAAQLAEKARQDAIAAKAQADALAAAAAAAAAVADTTVASQVVDKKLTLADDAYTKSVLESQRALVRGWYANNPYVVHNPSQAEVDDWVSQLNMNDTTFVFAKFSDFANMGRGSLTSQNTGANYMQMQEEAIAQKAANEAADRRNSVLSWYAGNQDADKNPSEASIAYWTNQLVVKPYDIVFADFTNTVAAYVEQQRIAAANAAAEQQALEKAKARELAAIAAAKAAATEIERMAAEQAAAVERANIAAAEELRRQQEAATAAQLAEKARQDAIAAKAQADALAAAAAAAAAVADTTVATQIVDSKLTLADDAYTKSALESQRALVRGWYADNPRAIKNPSAVEVDYWANQLSSNTTNDVFNSFTVAVNKIFESTVSDPYTFLEKEVITEKTSINPLALLAIASYFFTG